MPLQPRASAIELMCERADSVRRSGRPPQSRGRPAVDSGVARPHRAATAAAHSEDRVADGHRRQTREPTLRSRRSRSPPRARCSGSWTKAIHVHGAAGLSRDFPLASAYVQIRTPRLADGPRRGARECLARNDIRRQAAAREHGRAGQATLRSHSGLVVTHIDPVRQAEVVFMDRDVRSPRTGGLAHGRLDLPGSSRRRRAESSATPRRREERATREGPATGHRHRRR